MSTPTTDPTDPTGATGATGATPTVPSTPAAPAVDVDALLRTVARMADVLGDGMTACQTGAHFTCGEAETLADVLTAAGHREAAATWLLGHALGDDDPDDDPDHLAMRAADAARGAALTVAPRTL